jgi:hypothetical protein
LLAETLRKEKERADRCYRAVHVLFAIELRTTRALVQPVLTGRAGE